MSVLKQIIRGKIEFMPGSLGMDKYLSEHSQNRRFSQYAPSLWTEASKISKLSVDNLIYVGDNVPDGIYHSIE